MSGFAIHLDFAAEPGVREIGTPPITDEHDVLRCPVCNADLADEYIPGYGLAYGGGLGTYWTCTNEDCCWFFKRLDSE